MANTIAFSTGTGSGGNIIKSIQRGESPIYTLHCSLHNSDKDIMENYDINLVQREIPISSVDPDKSIILTTPIFAPLERDMDCSVFVTDFTSSYIKCAILSRNWVKIMGGYTLVSPVVNFVDSVAYTFYESNINIEAECFAHTRYWAENIYTGSSGYIYDAEIPTDQCRVSYQIIEFY